MRNTPENINGREVMQLSDALKEVLIEHKRRQAGEERGVRRGAKLDFVDEIGGYDWQEDAACLESDPSLFLSDEPIAVRAAIAICEKCVVIEQCHDFAERNDEMYVWGGQYRGPKRKSKDRRPRSTRIAS